VETLYCCGSEEAILDRLRADRWDVAVRHVQFSTREGIDGVPGWQPSPDNVMFPTCPVVGDTFLMRSYYNDGKNGWIRHRWWKVVARRLSTSGPSATEMDGIVHLLVEPPDFICFFTDTRERPSDGKRVRVLWHIFIELKPCAVTEAYCDVLSDRASMWMKAYDIACESKIGSHGLYLTLMTGNFYDRPRQTEFIAEEGRTPYDGWIFPPKFTTVGDDVIEHCRNYRFDLV